MSNEVAERQSVSLELKEKVLLGGDLSKLTPAERLSYYSNVCLSLGLNPLTRPFEYLNLPAGGGQFKMVLYARKDATEQLRTNRKISVTIVDREVVEGVYVVTARATDPSGRFDESIGAVQIDKLVGNERANAMMKAETKAKRRVTLSICGLGMLDETEVETIKDAKPLVNIPETRPKQDATMVREGSSQDVRGLPDDFYPLPTRQEDGAGSGTGASQSNSPLPQQASDAPAPKSAADFAMQQAEKVGANERTVVGFIVSFAPYQGPKAFAKGVKPGFFDVETDQGGIALSQVRYFDPKFNTELNQPGPLTITYTSELYNGKTQYKLLKVEADKAED